MKHTAPRRLLPAALLVAGGRSQEAGRCVELNFRAADLQISPACALLNRVVDGGDILDVALGPDIDATCGFHAEYERPTCVEGVAAVVAGMTDADCVVTGGQTVARFVDQVHDGRDGFAYLNRIVCTRQCFAQIQRAVQRCDADRGDADACMSSVTCACVDDLLSMFETLPDDGPAAFPRFAAAMDEIARAGARCRCDALNERAAALAAGPACALARAIADGGELLAGDDAALADACAVASGGACVEDVVDALGQFADTNCDISFDPDLMYTIESFREDFQGVADFACGDACYAALRTCSLYRRADVAACLAPLSCACQGRWLALADGLAPDFRAGFLRAGAATLDVTRRAVQACACARLNAAAGALRTEGYCALQASLSARGDLFAEGRGEHGATCRAPRACGGNVTAAVRAIAARDCAFRQDTDESAMFLYNVNDNNEWEDITAFVCNDPEDGCYTEIGAALGDCAHSAPDACLEAASPSCVDAFLDVLARLSEDAKDKYLGVDFLGLDVSMSKADGSESQEVPIEEMPQEEMQNETATEESETPPNAASPLAVGAARAAAGLLALPWLLL